MEKYRIWHHYYDVDESGVVWNKRSGYVLSQYIQKGYRGVMIQILGERYNLRVHRLVALKYLPNPYCYAEINHKDGNRANNAVENLEWCTRRQNAAHALKSGSYVRGEDHPRAKLSNVEVVFIRERIGHGETYRGVWGDYKDRIGWWSFREICRGRQYVGFEKV